MGMNVKREDMKIILGYLLFSVINDEDIKWLKKNRCLWKYFPGLEFSHRLRFWLIGCTDNIYNLSILIQEILLAIEVKKPKGFSGLISRIFFRSAPEIYFTCVGSLSLDHLVQIARIMDIKVMQENNRSKTKSQLLSEILEAIRGEKGEEIFLK